MSNNNPLLYLLTPVEIQPEKEGRYVVKTDDGFFEVNYDERYGFHEEFTDCSGVTHYLRPIASLPAAPGWVKCSDRMPPDMVIDMYHTKYIITDLDDTILMPGGYTYNGNHWETPDNVQVVEWYDESIPQESREECLHLPLIDTGVGYYFCPACKESWTVSEWEGKSGKSATPTASVEEPMPDYYKARNRMFSILCRMENGATIRSAEISEVVALNKEINIKYAEGGPMLTQSLAGAAEGKGAEGDNLREYQEIWNAARLHNYPTGTVMGVGNGYKWGTMREYLNSKVASNI